MRDYISTPKEMKDKLLQKYQHIPRKDIQAYLLLNEESGVNDLELLYEERHRRHILICELLELPVDSGLAGRDI